MKFIKIKKAHINAEMVSAFNIAEDMPDFDRHGSKKEAYTMRFFFSSIEDDALEIDFYKSSDEDMKLLKKVTMQMMDMRMLTEAPEYMERFK